MLRVSAREAGWPLDVAGVGDPSVDPGVPGGAELVAFTRAVVDRTAGAGPARATARRRLVETLGVDAAVTAAAVAGNFEQMNRVVDGTGLPPNRHQLVHGADIIATLALDRFPHAPR